ncbi:MAG: hypothetical protein QCI82_05000 [Candidatus Thermoplasmatota archaeon]|nr:hypothetical protein [Candidatus Thermoplasmatota archaeon]
MSGNIEKEKRPTGAPIVIVIVVLLCIVLLISGIALLGSIFFNWGQEIDKGQNTNDVIIVRAGITYSRTYEGEFNTLTFVVMGLEVEWDRYDVRADGISLPHSDDIDWAGDIEEFTWDVEGENIGEELEVMVIDIEADKVIWQSSLVVTAGQIEDVVDTINIRAEIT